MAKREQKAPWLAVEVSSAPDVLKPAKEFDSMEGWVYPLSLTTHLSGAFFGGTVIRRHSSTVKLPYTGESLWKETEAGDDRVRR